MTVDHYENFPVASILLPKPLRWPITVIYHFARSADDIADEGSAAPEERLAGLAHYNAQLDRIERGETPTETLFADLCQVIRKYRLPLQLFRDLLDAFAQDVRKTRYDNFPELMDYCRRSADPVGRLLLHLFGHDCAENLRRSDCICSALQLINHWQDVAIDWKKPRLYLPQDDLARYSVSEKQIGDAINNDNWRALMRFQVTRARALMLEGAPLGRDLPGRIGLEIRLIVQGGLAILDKIEAVNYDVFRQRPVLGGLDWPRLLLRAL